MGIVIEDIIQTSELGKLYKHTLLFRTSISTSGDRLHILWFFPNNFIAIPIEQAAMFETLLKGVENEVRFIPGPFIEEFVVRYFPKARD